MLKIIEKNQNKKKKFSKNFNLIFCSKSNFSDLTTTTKIFQFRIYFSHNVSDSTENFFDFSLFIEIKIFIESDPPIDKQKSLISGTYRSENVKR